MTVRKLLINISSVFIFASSVFAQEAVTKAKIEMYFQSFEYEKVVELTGKMLNENKSLADSEKIDLLMMQTISYYSMSDEAGARRSIIEILSLDKDYNPDPVMTSPKIIAFFNKIKIQFHQILARQKTKEHDKKPEIAVKDSSGVDLELISRYKTAIVKSIILPGWGHLHLENKTKGWIITSLGAALIGGTIYTAIDAAEKRSKYLSSAETAAIPELYDDFNSAYKLRNIFIAAYSALWIYSQIDILFFQYDDLLIKNSKSAVTFLPNIDGGYINFSIQF